MESNVIWNRGVSHQVEFNISSCSPAQHCHLFQKIFWAKTQMLLVLWRICMWIREDRFPLKAFVFGSQTVLVPSYCRTSFLILLPLPLPFFVFPVQSPSTGLSGIHSSLPCLHQNDNMSAFLLGTSATKQPLKNNQQNNVFSWNNSICNTVWQLLPHQRPLSKMLRKNC